LLPVEIDFCSPDDLEALCFVEQQCFSPPWPRELIEKDLSGEGNYLYLSARAGGAIIGFAAMRKRGRRAELANLAVLPAFRRRGVASQLLAGVGEIGLELGCRAITLQVRVSNEGAAALYGMFGFSVIGRDRGYYADGEDAFVMEGLLPLRLPADGEPE
jgi:ribosomal-protein-alanine N-acetyltransferase